MAIFAQRLENLDKSAKSKLFAPPCFYMITSWIAPYSSAKIIVQ
jgi:hypothetical protein